MTYKQIESSREVRLLIGQVIVPAVATVGTIVAAVPEVRYAVVNKVKSIRQTLKNKSKKNNEES